MHSQYDTFRPGSVMSGSIARFGLVGMPGDLSDNMTRLPGAIYDPGFAGTGNGFDDQPPQLARPK